MTDAQPDTPETAVRQPIPYSQEVLRKLVHLSSNWMVALIWFFPWDKMLLVYLFAACLILNLLCEFAYSCRVPVITQIYAFFFKNMLRNNVKRGQWVVSGGPPVWAAAALVTLCFPQKIAAIGLGVMLIADTAAALVGRRFGKHKTVNGKSLEGVAAFCAAGWIFSLTLLACGGMLNWKTLTGALIGVFFASLPELFEKQLHADDNLSIPLVTAFFIWLAV